MTSVQELPADVTAPGRAEQSIGVQSGGYLLELSLDWIVLRASENIHHLLGRSHALVVDEPLGRFVHSQALHDLRNLFSRLSGTTGIARAYRVRLTDEPDLADIAFQLSDGRVLLEAVPCVEGHYGEAFGTVGGLIAGLSSTSGQALLDGGARRMRALTGYDRVTIFWDGSRAESSRGPFANSASRDTPLPAIVADCEQQGVAVFPRDPQGTSLGEALLRAPDSTVAEQLRSEGVRATLKVPFDSGGISGEFRCDSRVPHRPSFEVHAAAELFAQLFALRLEIDRLKSA
jgi:light-regulated signal transduction histidine kinase (bacteriophytochrome)